MLISLELETVEYRIHRQIYVYANNYSCSNDTNYNNRCSPFPMSNRKGGIGIRVFPRVEEAKSRGPPEIHPCLSCSGLGLGTSRGKERRRTSRPTNLHIWLRVATAPIGIAKSQIGLVRGPDPLRPHARPLRPPWFDGDGFRGKVFPGKLFVTLAFPRRALSLSRDFNTWNYATRGLFHRV